jgi:Tfp pilus assembly PilM family ATPase
MAGVLDKLGRWMGGGRLVAVDFDRRHLRLVESVRTAGVATLHRLRSVELPEDLDVNDAQALGHVLAGTLREMGLSGARLLMNVPRGQSVLKPLTFPPGTDAADLPDMVLYQMESELPFPVADAAIDFTVETHYAAEAAGQDEEEGVDVLVAAVRLGIVDYYRRVASAAGSKLLGLGLRPYSNVRCLRSCLPEPAEEGEGLALVYLTADEAEIDVLSGPGRGRLAFSRSAAVLAPGAEEDPSARAQAVVTEAARSLRSYQTLDSGGRIDSVLVAGGTGLETDVADALSRRLAVSCERFDPSAGLGLSAGVDASGFLPALGLAAGPDERPLDFLAPKKPPVRRDKRKLRVAGIAAGVLAVLAGLWVAAAVHLGAKEARLAELKRQVKENEPHVDAARELEDCVERIESWQSGGRDWLTHWAHVACLFPSCRDAYVTSVRTGSDGRMGLEVRARQPEVIDDLRRKLTEAGYRFKSDGVSTAPDPHGYKYQAPVDLRIPEDMEVDLSTVEPEPRPADDVAAGRGAS